MQRCPHCQAELENALGCSACGKLLDPPAELSPFALFGLEPGFALDARALDKRLRAAMRLVHPDVHAGAPAAERASERRGAPRSGSGESRRSTLASACSRFARSRACSSPRPAGADPARASSSASFHSRTSSRKACGTARESSSAGPPWARTSQSARSTGSASTA